MAETLLSQGSDISQGVMTASFWGSLKTADGKTQTVESSEGKDGGVKQEFLHDLIVACGLKS